MMTLLLMDAEEPTAAVLTELPMPPAMLPPSITPTVATLPVLLEVRLDTSTVLITGDEYAPWAVVLLDADADEPTALIPMLLETLSPEMPAGVVPSP